MVDELGQLDVLVNSAAVMHQVAFEDTTPALYDEVLELNLRSVFFVSQGAAPFLRKARGKIVNLADLGGLEPWPGYAAHSISKAGVVMLTRILATEPGARGHRQCHRPGRGPGARRVLAKPSAHGSPNRRRSVGSERQRTPCRPCSTCWSDADFVTGDVIVVDGGRVLR